MSGNAVAIYRAAGKAWRWVRWLWPKLCLLTLVLVLAGGLHALRRVCDDHPVV